MDQVEQHRTHTGHELTYDQYWSLLLSAAAAYDEGFEFKHYNTRPTRSIYQHDLEEVVPNYEDSTDSNESDSFDIDMPVEVIQVFSTNFKGTRKLMDPENQEYH